MSGPEWTNDEPESRAPSRALIASEVAPAVVTATNLDQAHAQPPEPAMAQHTADQDQDQDETESPETPAPGTLWKILGILKKIPLPSLGSERHEMLLDVNRAPAEPHAETHPQPAHAPSRPAAKAPVLHLRRETRVGLAIVFSFVVLVIALVVQKGWIGRSPSTLLAVKGPDTPEAKAKEEAEAKAKEEAEAKAKEEAEAKAKAETEAKAKAEAEAKAKKDNADPKTESKEGPEPKPVPESTSEDKKSTTELPPVQTNESKPPEGLPKGESDPSKLPPMLPETPTNLPNLPETPSSKAADLPAVPGNEPSLPPPSPEPKSEPKPADLPAVAPTTAPTTPEPAPSALPTPADLPPTPVETKPAATELNPKPAIALPTTPTPTTAANPPESIPAQPQPPPPTPQPPPTPVAPEPLATTPTTPVPSEKTPPLESIPSNPAPAPAPVEPAAATTSMGGASPAVVAASTAAPGAGWVVIQSGGRRIPGTRSIVSTPSNSESELNPPTPPRFADGPRPTSDLDADDQFEPVLHTVQAGENFWTISRLYYKSPRYYRALHAANATQVPNIKKLYIGTVLKIPPPEKLDRSLIDPETSPVTKTTKKADPTDLTDLAPPVRPRLIRADPEIAETPRRPTYKVKPNDTLRSIARETLGDSRREKEIYNLNRDALDDPKDIPPGTMLTLPEDAKLARSVR